MEDHVAKLANELRRDMSSELQGLVENLTKLAEARGDTTTNPSATVTFNASGIAAWVSGTCLVITLVVVGLSSIWVTREFDRQDRQLVEIREENKTMQAYLAAVYQAAPHLKPPEGKTE